MASVSKQANNPLTCLSPRLILSAPPLIHQLPTYRSPVTFLAPPPSSPPSPLTFPNPDQETDQKTFDILMKAPLLLSKEQDMLVEGLRAVSRECSVRALNVRALHY